MVLGLEEMGRYALKREVEEWKRVILAPRRGAEASEASGRRSVFHSGTTASVLGDDVGPSYPCER